MTSTAKATGVKPSISWPPGPPSYRRYLYPLFQRLLAKSSRPILVGPWRGEVGFEALYWTPFLNSLREHFEIPAERLIPITRGGFGALYRTPMYLELYAMRSPQDIRIENRLQHQQTGMLKQMTITPWDRAVLTDAAKTLNLTKYHVLHPAWMYQALAPFWDAARGAAWLDPQLNYTLLPQPALEGVTLPERFVCVKFYARATFPANPMTANIARETIKQLASQTPVVLLTTDLHADDHLDFTLKEPIPNVQRLSDLTTVTPETNLALQAAVLSRSLGFVGTYGGVAQLALRLGKPSISLYTDWGGTAWAHKHLSEMVASRMNLAFQVQRVSELPMLQTSLPKFVLQG
jgi:hypothetical protein